MGDGVIACNLPTCIYIYVYECLEKKNSLIIYTIFFFLSARAYDNILTWDFSNLLAVDIRLAYVYCGNGHDNGVLNLFLELC